MANGKYTVDDIVTRVQRTFGDESAVQVQDADIIRWINDACREVVMQHENLLMAEQKIDSTVGVRSYAAPADCYTINTIMYRDSDDEQASFYALRYLSNPQMTQLADGWHGDDYGNGTPQVFSRNADNTFVIHPAPDVSRNEAILVRYAKYASDVTSSLDEIPIPAYYHMYVLDYCLMKAYEMDEDWEAADRKATVVQSTIDFNNARENWYGRNTYPTITTNYEDYE